MIFGVIKRIEEQINGVIVKEDWYLILIVGYIVRFFEVFMGLCYYMISYFVCGVVIYVFFDCENKCVVLILRFFDVEGFVEFFESKVEEIEQWKKFGKFQKFKFGVEIFMKFRSFYDDKYVLKGVKVFDFIKNVFMYGNYDVFGKFYENVFFVGMMYFMDEYNYDVECVECCVIYYVMFDGRIVFFCIFNVILEFYCDKVQVQFSYIWEEWKVFYLDWDYKKDKYFCFKEFVEKMRNSEFYRKIYIDIEDYFGLNKE